MLRNFSDRRSISLSPGPKRALEQKLGAFEPSSVARFDLGEVALVELEDFGSALEAALSGAVAVEVALPSSVKERHFRDLRLVRELSYPLPLIARIEEGGAPLQEGLLQKLAIYGVSALHLSDRSFETAYADLVQIQGVNKTSRLGLRVFATLLNPSSQEKRELRRYGADLL